MPGWHETYGTYTNGEPGHPLLVSLLIYLDEQWRSEWAAETLFVQPQVCAATPPACPRLASASRRFSSLAITSDTSRAFHFLTCSP